MEVDDAVLIAFTILALIGLLAIYIFTGISAVRKNPLFQNNAGEVSRRFQTDITPADYTFGIWNLIFLSEAVWVLYAVGSLFRTTAEGPILMNPDVVPVEFYLFWIASCIFYVVWLFLWDRGYLLLAFIDLLLLTLSGYAAVAYLGIATFEHKDELNAKSNIDVTLIYVFVQNGTDLLYSWVTVASLLNLSSALTYDPMVKKNLSRETSSTISLAILGLLVFVWCVLENTVFFDYFLYVYAWYGVLIWTAVGILVKNFNRTSRNTVITVLILCLSIVCMLVKIVVYATKTQLAS